MRIYWKRTYTTYVKLILVALFFGSTFISGKILSANLPTYTSAFLRFFLASLFLILLIFIKFKKIPSINLSQIYLLIILALTGVVGYNVLFFSGLKFINASRASMIISLNPTMIALFSTLILKERFNRFKYLGILLSLTGVLIVISEGRLLEVFQGKIGYGELLILGCVVCWSSFSVLGKVAMSRYNLKSILIIVYACIIGAIILFFPAFQEGQLQKVNTFSREVWISLLALSFFGTVLAFNWFYEGIEEIGPSRAGIFINFVPIFATLMAVLILEEKLSPSLILGAVLVVSGVCIINYPQKP